MIWCIDRTHGHTRSVRTGSGVSHGLPELSGGLVGGIRLSRLLALTGLAGLTGLLGNDAWTVFGVERRRRDGKNGVGSWGGLIDLSRRPELFRLFVLFVLFVLIQLNCLLREHGSY